LNSTVITERQSLVLKILRKEVEALRIQEKIIKNLGEEDTASLKTKYLEEEIKKLESQLGLDKGSKEKQVGAYLEKLKGKTLTPVAQEAFDTEISKLRALEPSSSEYNVTKNYLDWFTDLPWGLFKDPNVDIKKAEKVLDEDHFGMKKIKERILEYIAVSSLKGTGKGKILCLVGPPGVGKTSIGASMARSMNREFTKVSVGGLHDVGEIKGHRRTYVGSFPGKIISSLKRCCSSNPVIMIDEIDKVAGRNFHGDPSSAFLEVLDPEQNSSFLDHYLDVPFDLSKVLFVCTANETDPIPQPLLDRMEVFELSGYILEEKMHIAKEYLIPKISKNSGLKDMKLTDGVLQKLIREYCRESGVRSLNQKLEAIGRKMALALITKTPIKKVTEKELVKMLGLPLFPSDRIYDKPPVGVAMGMAYNAVGGATFYAEATKNPQKSERKAENKNVVAVVASQETIEDSTNIIKKTEIEKEVLVTSNKSSGLTITGHLGGVLKESVGIAYSFSKNFLKRLAPHNTFFGDNSIHLHHPEGAVPKDGPSAGITITTAFLSLALNIPIKNDFAMTGEITLTGTVGPIGGVREKSIAAKRAGVTHIIFPKENERNWKELDSHIKDGLTVYFVENYREVFDIIFDKEELQKALRPPQQQQQSKVADVAEKHVDVSQLPSETISVQKAAKARKQQNL